MRVIGNRAIVRPDVQPEKPKTKDIDTILHPKCVFGTVIVAPDHDNNKQSEQLDVSIGDRVYFNLDWAEDFELNGETLYVCDDGDILFVDD